MAEPIGSLHAEVTASTLKYRQELDRGKQAARGFARDSTRELSKTGGAIAKTTTATAGMNASITASAGLMRNFGAAALGPMGELANNFATLSAGAGTLGVALVALTIVFLDIKKGMELARAESDKTTESLMRQRKASQDLLDVRKRIAALDDLARQERTGKSGDLLAIEDELQRIEAAMVAAEVARERALRSGSGLGGGLLGLDLSGMKRQRNVAEGVLANLAARRRELERAMTRIQAEESQKRVETEEKEAEKRAAVAAKLALKAAEAERKRSEALTRAAVSGHTKRGDVLFDALAARREADEDRAALGETALQRELRLLERQRSAEWKAARAIGASTEAINRKFAALRELTEAQYAHNEAQAEAARKLAEENALREEIDKRTPTLSGALGGYFDFGGKPGEEKPADVKRELTDIERLSRRVGDTFASSFGSALANAAMEARNLGEALRDVGRLVLSTALQMFVSGSVTTAFSALKLPGFANGGSFTVGGAGGVDSQLVAFKASPGERVNVAQPGAGGGMNVVVHNYAGADVSTRETLGPTGPQLDVVVEQIVNGSLERGGSISRTLGRTHGLRRRGRRG